MHRLIYSCGAPRFKHKFYQGWITQKAKKKKKKKKKTIILILNKIAVLTHSYILYG